MINGYPNADKFLKFKKACDEAIELGNMYFLFENKNFLVKYAVLIIEDIEEKIKTTPKTSEIHSEVKTLGRIGKTGKAL